MIVGDPEEPMVEYKMREGRRIVGFTLKQYPDVEAAYETFERPRPSLLIAQAATRICLDYAHATGEISGAQDVLTYGMLDVTRLIIPALARHPSIPKQQAMEIAASHSTVMAHALGARIPVEQTDATLFDHPGKTFDVSADGSHIEITDPSITPNQERGCAAVHIGDGEIQKVDPLFERFSIWAGHLAFIAHYEHRQ